MEMLEYNFAKEFEQDGQIRPGNYNYTGEILPALRERRRFSGLLKAIGRINGGSMSKEVFTDLYTKHFFIHSADLNDGLLAVIAIYNAVCEKCDASLCINDFVVDRSRRPSSKDTAPASLSPAVPAVNSVVGIDLGFGRFQGVADSIDREDVPEAVGEEAQKNVTAEIFLYHLTDPKEIFRCDESGNNLCFVIYADAEMQEHKKQMSVLSEKFPGITVNYPDPKYAAAELHYNYVETAGDSKEDLKKYMLDYFSRQKFSADRVDKQINRLLTFPYIKNEAQITAAAKNIINRHLENYGDTEYLCSKDFSDYIEIKKTKRPGQEELVIGLEKEKQILNSAVNMLMLNIERKSQNLSTESPSCNMIFAGAPGTAKTTLARIFAKKLSELGIIPGENSFHECRKSDIIGQYVGHTAKKVDDLFTQIHEQGGGVIFFDEIYTIAEKDGTSFDTEALNCITQNMENYRSTVYCIFAGYENKMREFIEANPGLSSRISTSIRFSSYSDKELCEIFNFLVKTDNFKVDGECHDVLTDFFSELRKEKGDSFGNGREARNLFENAKRIMAARIFSKKRRSREMLSTISASDIRNAAKEILTSVIKEKNKTAHIGF